jgi:hypothetical protein
MKRIAGLICLLCCSTSVLAQAPQYREPEKLYSGVNLIRGTVVAAYRVDPTEDFGSGLGFDANYSSVAVNFGVASKKFGESPLRPEQQTEIESDADGERVNNVYAGVGFSRILMFQYGYGNHGPVVRLRSDFNFRSIVSLLTDTHVPKDRMTLADRITFTFATERYNDDDEEIYDNFTWGVGLLF